MMQVIPSYQVTYRVKTDQLTLRVPRSDLEAFLRVLIFNDARMIRVEEETMSAQQEKTIKAWATSLNDQQTGPAVD